MCVIQIAKTDETMVLHDSLPYPFSGFQGVLFGQKQVESPALMS